MIDVGPGAGDEGGLVVASGPPDEVALAPGSRTAPYLRDYLAASGRDPAPAHATGGRTFR